MKTKKEILISMAMIITIACSEKKDDVIPFPDTGGYTSLQDFNDDVKITPQIFQINNAAGGSITGSEGTQLTFLQNAFVQENGNAVTGNVDIRLYEANKKSEMVLGKVFTTTSTVPLISGGQFKLVAYQDGVKLKFAPWKKASISIPATNPDNDMIAYVENPLSETFNYTFPNDSITFIYLNGSSYVGFTDSMVWINCDHPFVQATYKTLTISAGPGFDASTARVALVFNDVNTATSVGGSSAFVYPYAPAGYSVTVVGIGIKDGKLYSGFYPLTISNDQTINLSLAQTTLEQLRTDLSVLD